MPTAAVSVACPTPTSSTVKVFPASMVTSVAVIDRAVTLLVVMVMASVVLIWVVMRQPQTETVQPSPAEPSVSVYSAILRHRLVLPDALSATPVWVLLMPSAVAELSVTPITKTSLSITKLADGFIASVVPMVSVTACPRASGDENAIRV